MVKVLEINNLDFDKFKDLNLVFNKETFYSIVGGNNSGKTTLFKLITGMIPSNNRIICGGIYLNSHNIYQYIQNIGIVERISGHDFIYQKVKDEMMYPLYNLGYSKKRIVARINEVIDLFDVDFLDKNINELNRYEREILLVMIALLHKPKVLLLDNIFSLLATDETEKLLKVLKTFITREKITIINFSSTLNEVLASDKIILLSDFKILGEYELNDIYQDDQLFYQSGLEIPFIIDLSVKLKMYDLIDKNYTNVKEMVDDIWL